MASNGRSSYRGGGNNKNATMSKTAEKFKALCPSQKWKDLEQLVKQQNGDEGAIQAKIMEWWEEGEAAAPKAEEQWENVNKKKPKNKYLGGGGGGSTYNTERSGRDAGRGRGGGPSGRGGRGAGGYRGRGGAPSGRGPKGPVGKPRDAPAPVLATEDTSKPEADIAPGVVPSSAPTAASIVINGGRAPPKEYVTTESKPARVQPEGFISSNDPTPSGRTSTAAAAAAAPVVKTGANVWATKGAAHIIKAEKPLPPPVVPPPRHPVTSKSRNLPSESKSESESSSHQPQPLSPDLPLPVAPSAPLESTLEQDVGALEISAGAETSATEETFNSPTAAADQAETETLLSEASSMAGLSASVNGANVNAAGWKPLLNEHGNVIDLAPPAEESKNVPAEEESDEELPEPPRVVSPPLSGEAEAPLPPQEIVTSAPVSKPGPVLNMGRWDVNDGDEQAIDFGFGSFGVDADDTPDETPPSNGLPAVVTDKVTAAKEAVAAATLSPARPPPGLGLGGGAMPPMPAGAVLVHELEGKLEAATKAKEEVAPEVPDKTQSAVEEVKPAGPQTQAAEAPPTANVSVPSALPQAPGIAAPQTSAGGMYPSAGYPAAPGMANMYSAYSGAGGFMGGVGVGGMPTLLNPQQQAQQAAAQQAAQQPPNKGPSFGVGAENKDDATENTITTAASTAGATQTNPSSAASSASALNNAFPPGMMAYNPAAAAAFQGGFYGQHAGYAHHGHQMAANPGLSGNVNLPYGAYGGYPPAQFAAGGGGYASAYQQQLAAQMGVGGGVGGPPGSSQAGGVGYGAGGAYGDSSGGNQGSSGGVGEQQHLNLGGASGSGNDSRGIGGSGGYGGNKSNYRGNRNNNYNQGGGGGGYGSHSHSQQSQYNQHNPAGLHQQHGGLGYGGGNPYGAGMAGYGSQGMDHFQAQRGYGGAGLHSHNAYGMQQQNSYGNQALGGGQGGFGQAQDTGMDSLDSRGGGHNKNKGNKPRGAGGFGNSANMQHQFQQGGGGVGGGQPFGGLQQQGPEHGSAGASSAGGGGNSSTGGWGQQGWGGAGATNSWQQGGGN